MKKYTPLDLRSAKCSSLRSRKSRIAAGSCAGVPVRGDTFSSFIHKLPDVYAAADFRGIVKAIVSARRKERPVILGMGAHPIKLGLSPVINFLIENGIVTAVAANGACIVHDFEMALAGHTSEDVASELCSGTFGMSKETGKGLNLAINRGVRKGYGIGRSVGEAISKGRFPFKGLSIFAKAHELDIPASVHVAIGTDIIHMHREADGSCIGRGSLLDFRLLASVIADLEGGVYLNLGSAVILPEVFLKALNIARNLGNTVNAITTVNMDFIQRYRPKENVLKRPTLNRGKHYAITGHHEIMLPLLAAALMEEM